MKNIIELAYRIDPALWVGRELGVQLRIPVKATTLSGAWRPRDPVDDDHGGARA
jgi:hypothetical protein